VVNDKIDLIKQLIMQISNIEYISESGRPLLKLDVEGQKVLLDAEPKATVFSAGYVYLPGFEDKLPPVTIAGKEYAGLTNDPDLFRVYARFGFAVGQGIFRPGDPL
jgi:hypothetical protein